MARFAATVELTPVPRSWFEHAVATGWDALTEHLGSAPLPLVDGTPLARGAHYANEDTTVTLDAWDRDAESAGRVTTTDADMTTTCHVRLHSAAAPRAIQLEGGTTDGRRLTTVTGSVTADLGRWWAGGTAAAGRFDHPMGRVEFEVGRVAGERWQVEVTVTVRGRGVWRPLFAPVLLVGRRVVRREFVTALARFAERWDAEVPRYLALSPDELRARIDAELDLGLEHLRGHG